MKKEVIPLKTVVQELWTGEDSLIDPVVPALIGAWVRVVPDSLRSGICLEGIREGTLCLAVFNPVAGQQFQFLKDSIREKINTLVGRPVVKGFRMRAGSPPETKTGGREKTDPVQDVPRALTKKEKKRIDNLCAEIKNPEIRERVRAAMEKSRSFESARSVESPGCKPRLSGKPLKGEEP